MSRGFRCAIGDSGGSPKVFQGVPGSFRKVQEIRSRGVMRFQVHFKGFSSVPGSFRRFHGVTGDFRVSRAFMRLSGVF